jgi:integrase
MVERAAVNRDVVGSSPTSGANFPRETEEKLQGPKDSLNISEELAGESEQNVKFPKRLRYRGKGKPLATIYKRPDQSQPYRLYWRARVDGKPKTRFKDFGTYSAAKRAGDKVVEERSKASQALFLSPGQTNDALAAMERLRSYYAATGRRVSLLSGISQYCESAAKLNCTLGEAVDGYMRNIAVVKRKDLGEAVADFVQERQPLTEAKDGERPQLDPVYAGHVASCLKKFAATFPGTCVCDLTKDHLDRYNGQFKDLSPKSRNHNRVTVRMFLSWCVRKDFLAATHRLFEANGLKAESAPSKKSDHYRPGDFRKMLDGANEQMRAVIAIQGLAGLRLDEVLRLDWEDVFGIAGHIEVSTSKSKTKQRRLVTICPALKQWLAPYRQLKGKVVTEWDGLNDYVRAFAAMMKDLGVPVRKNGLRHGFVTYHLAAHNNENLTAALAGNSPGIIHSNYKGLATKKEAAKWFGVKPAKAHGKVIQLSTASEV